MELGLLGAVRCVSAAAGPAVRQDGSGPARQQQQWGMAHVCMSQAGCMLSWAFVDLSGCTAHVLLLRLLCLSAAP